mgnify:CR=1 FL=1
MSYHLTEEQVARLKNLILQGNSLRQLAGLTKHSKNTICHYRNKLLSENNVFCRCGLPITHQGWCKFRFEKSAIRQNIIKNFHTGVCVDCYGPRSLNAGLRCYDCYQKRAAAKRRAKAEETRRCKICDKTMLIRRNGKCWMHCGKEWCERLYTFYYVEGRNRPLTVRGGKNNGLKFEYFLSDYIRRYANEQTCT